MSSRRDTENRMFRSLTAPRELDWGEFSNLLARFFPEKFRQEPEVICWARRMYDGVHEAFVKAEISQISSRWPPRAAVANRLGKIADTAEKLLELLTGELPSNDETGSEENRELVSSSNRIRYAIEEIAGADPRVLHGMLDGLPKLADVAKRARDWARAEPKEGLELALEREQGPGIGRPRGSGDAFKDAFLKAFLPVWNELSGRPARLDARTDTEAPCPFCDFCAKYFAEAGIGGDSAEALAARCHRALSACFSTEKQ
jgi:hypothetical protein